MSDIPAGMVLAVAIGALFVAMGVPTFPLIALLVLIVFLLAYRAPYATFYTALFLSPLLGLTVSIPLAETNPAASAFGGSIDIGAAEVVFALLACAWVCKVIWLWFGRRDSNWQPRFPLIWPYLAIVAAHVASLWSPLRPERASLIKFAARPVAWMYVAFILLPVNFIRSRRRLRGALVVVVIVGTLAALNGAISLFFVDASSQYIHRAHPLPLFGIPVLGDNHNLLAEFFVTTVPWCLALALLCKTPRAKRFALFAAIFQFIIGLLTFSRTGWIVFGIEAIVLGWMMYRETVRRYLAPIVAVAMLLVPLGAIMVNISASNVAISSNSTRTALLEIAWNVFTTSPLLGGGAGTFVDRVGSAYVFMVEYGAPLDAHGFLQKILAETGIIGLSAVSYFFAALMMRARQAFLKMAHPIDRQILVLFATSVMGAVLYQLLNTNYWTGKMWLPVGLFLAAMHVLASGRDVSEESV